MFTPGKWTIDASTRDTSGWIAIRQDGGLTIASTYGHFSETNEADARLIAASKDLYQTVLDLLPLAEKAYGLKDLKVAAIRAIIDQIGGAK
jgi:hypothetical protein